MQRHASLNWDPSRSDIEAVLERAVVEDCRLVPSGSNYVFLLDLCDDEAGHGQAIYKPRKGEAPLWDFPSGTLYRRERAAYLLSCDLDWRFIPPTVIRDGPYETGSVQLYIPNDPELTFFTLRDAYASDMRRMAVFDAITNNADRKGGHCLQGPDGRIWGIDHGLTFNVDHKLRTVIWDYSDEPIEPSLVADLVGLRDRLAGQSAVRDALKELLDASEIEALRRRVMQLAERPVFPSPGFHRSVPWPPV